ncbi:N-methyl-D-aspartate receptor NMDAR2C subunit [Massilia sp. G4R7]|uniref:N-methyl-D-aspartate receptor NMDAR2C subunit n=1 Tax=Massilia phyllostachyos TaxID=2898585 RepID=A0ABS8Q0Q3_9BURK|nr:N-methyl-D-aspartate receptor NMDAR2C subunit [Massilia phyllostachyos]MCD2515329.1 N-methyl-D-aspartate receptor NMDAR2C subunit [Massilia phyllostachyos]
MDRRAAKGWTAAWRTLGVAEPAGLYNRLLDAWSEPQRHYHTLQHLTECLTLADGLREEMTHPEEVVLALWFHDAVYDVRAHDNEARSAQWAVQALGDAGLAKDACERVEALIMATCHGAAASPGTPDSALLVDIDLAILGSDEARFAEYEAQIRAEYAWVPPDVFAVKRREVLRGFLDRARIYTTDTMVARFEAQARRNLASA